MSATEGLHKGMVIRRDGHTLYNGNYSFYVEQDEQQRVAATPKRGRKEACTPRRDKSKASPYDRLSIDELEKLVIEREVKLSLLHERFGDQAVCRDQDALAELREQADALTGELAELDAAWRERVDTQ